MIKNRRTSGDLWQEGGRGEHQGSLSETALGSSRRDLLRVSRPGREQTAVLTGYHFEGNFALGEGVTSDRKKCPFP